MRDYVYELEDGVLKIIPKEVADKEYNNQINELYAKVNPKLTVDYLNRKNQKLVNVYENLLNSKMPESVDEFNEVVVLSSSLEEDGFLELHKDLFKDKDIKVCLNEGMDKYKSGVSNHYHPNNTNEIRKEYEYHDEEISYEEQDLERREKNVKNFSKNVKYKSIKFKENLKSENEYTASELENARKKIDDVAAVINSYKNLSPYEKFYLAFSYVQAYEYSKADEDKSTENSRALIQILNSKDIVCAGKANMLKAICDKIGIPCIFRICKGHAINTVAINDPKYSMHGLFNADATNQSRGNFLLFHEDVPMFRDVFTDIIWIAELSDKERKYLMEKSGLDKLPKEVLEASKKEFVERDDEILKKFKEIDDGIKISDHDKLRDIEDLNSEKKAYVELTYWYGVKQLIENDNLSYSEASNYFLNEVDFHLGMKHAEVKELGKLLELAYKINSCKDFKDSEDIAQMVYKDVVEYIKAKGSGFNEKSINDCLSDVNKQICEKIDEVVELSRKRVDEIKYYLNVEKMKNDVKRDNKIDVGKQIENLADSLVEMQGAHTKNDFDLTKAIVVGSKIDNAKTNNYDGEFDKTQLEYWQEFAKECGLDPEKIIPTADVRDFHKRTGKAI